MSWSFEEIRTDSLQKKKKNDTWSSDQENAEPWGARLAAGGMAFNAKPGSARVGANGLALKGGQRGVCFVISQDNQGGWSQPTGKIESISKSFPAITLLTFLIIEIYNVSSQFKYIQLKILTETSCKKKGSQQLLSKKVPNSVAFTAQKFLHWGCNIKTQAALT